MPGQLLNVRGCSFLFFFKYRLEGNLRDCSVSEFVVSASGFIVLNDEALEFPTKVRYKSSMPTIHGYLISQKFSQSSKIKRNKRKIFGKEETNYYLRIIASLGTEENQLKNY